MEEIIKRIEETISDIEKDTSRSKLSLLSKYLIELSHIYADNKRLYIRWKTKYNIEFPQIKNRLKKEKEWEKITQAELDVLTDMELQSTIKAKWDTEETISYLDPLLKSYYEYINTIKFIDKSIVREQQTINDIDL